MSFHYVNIERQKDAIKSKFSEILPLFDSLMNNEDMLFIIMTKLGCLINTFYRQKIFSTTDCCSTSDSIWSLFNPTNKKEFIIETTRDFNDLMNDNLYNIFNFRLIGDLTFHNFVILRYKGRWYLLQSYTNICELNVIKDDQLPNYLKSLLETGAVSLYNNLFKTNLDIKSTDNKIYYDVTAGHFNQLPVQKLRDKLDTFLKT